jgi:nicotinate-nucleotide adenylyltransferase
MASPVASLRILYGGTFDPVHDGHLAVANAAATLFDTNVSLLPSADPPHRPPPGASTEQRAAMLDLAVEGHPRLHVDRRELLRTGPSYSVDTLREVRSEIGPHSPLAWLLGADAFRELHTWHDWRALFGLAHLIVAARPGHALGGLIPELESEVAPRWTDDPSALCGVASGLLLRLDLQLRPDSATALRRQLAAGASIDRLVPPAVAIYIREHRLYRSEPA